MTEGLRWHLKSLLLIVPSQSLIYITLCTIWGILGVIDYFCDVVLRDNDNNLSLSSSLFLFLPEPNSEQVAVKSFSPHHQVTMLLLHPMQASRGRPQPSAGGSTLTEVAIVWTQWTSRTTLRAGALTWTWSSFTSTQSTGSLASSLSACFATSSSLLFDTPQAQTCRTLHDCR